MFEVRKIEFLEGLYATSDGRILDEEFNEVNKWKSEGYYEICYNGKEWRIHRLIAMVFIPNPQNKSIVHHINENKLDNRVGNLMWLSREEHMSLHSKGENNPNWGKSFSESHRKKLSEAKKGIIPKAKPPKPVYQYTLDKELVAIYPSTKEAGRNGFNQGHIAECCRGERKTHKGFIFSYVPL